MANRLFRALLRLLPEEFRSAYAREMEATFQAERREAREPRASARLWLSTTADVLRRAPAIHFDILRRDARLAIRTLTARPLALTAAIVTLAIGIGANIAMYAVVHTVLIRPLPYRDADRLVTVQESEAGGTPGNMGYLTFVDVRARSRAFTDLVAASQSAATLAGGGRDAERVSAMRVSRAYFDMLGVTPALGRTFLEAEDRPAAARRVVILSDSLWRRRFDADPSVIDRVIDISGVPFRIVGVLPPGFKDLVAARMYNGAEVWFPLGYDPAASFACRTCRHLRVFGRLAPGVTAERATTELSQVFAALERETPAEYRQAGAQVTLLPDLFLGPVRPVLLALWAGVMALLLVACANVSHLLLLRVGERAQEVAVRTALGVTRARLVRQFLTEALLLAFVGGTCGLGAAWFAIELVAAEGPAQIPRLADAALGGPALWAALVLVVVSGLSFGLFPLREVIRHTRTGLSRSGARLTESAAGWRSRAALVAGNVALAVVLLVGSGLLVRSLGGLLGVAPGLDPSHVLTLNLFALGERFRAGETPDQIAAAVRFYDDVFTRIRVLPGVTHAAAVTTLPMSGLNDGYSIHVQGRPPDPSGAVPYADRFVVTPEYFGALTIPLVRGRLLDERDRQGAESVAVINETAARALFAGEDPMGRRVALGPADAPPRTIVGIVGDVRHGGLDAPVGLQVYVPHAQWAWAETFLTVVVRATGDASALAKPVRDLVRALDPMQPVTNIAPYTDVLAAGIGTRRFAAMLLTVFAVTTVVMAMVGVYGSVGVVVAQRRREIGVRLALGATLGRIRALIVRQGLRPVLAGLAAGVVVAALSVRALDSMLYGVSALDAPTFLGALAGLGACALVACLIPAARAARIDPAATLRD